MSKKERLDKSLLEKNIKCLKKKMSGKSDYKKLNFKFRQMDLEGVSLTFDYHHSHHCQTNHHRGPTSWRVFSSLRRDLSKNRGLWQSYKIGPYQKCEEVNGFGGLWRNKRAWIS